MEQSDEQSTQLISWGKKEESLIGKNTEKRGEKNLSVNLIPWALTSAQALLKIIIPPNEFRIWGTNHALNLRKLAEM